MYTSNSTADDYNSSATFQQTGTGILNPAYNNNNTFAGDISSIGTNTNLTLGAGGGTVTINGSSAQTITGNTAFAFNIRRFVMNNGVAGLTPVSYTHLRAHETVLDLVCRLLLEKKKKHTHTHTLLT